MDDKTLPLFDTLLIALAVFGPLLSVALSFLVLPRMRLPPGTFGSVGAFCIIVMGMGLGALLGAMDLVPVPGGVSRPPDPALIGTAGYRPTEGAYTQLQLLMVAWIAMSTSTLVLLGTWRSVVMQKRRAREEAEGPQSAPLFRDSRWQ
ncbi:MAG: hypothetical protein H6742_20515 [Alphaproteobacteria bacterium]|nr:hypothetical protein [Alphaproteobacteria bacterium]